MRRRSGHARVNTVPKNSRNPGSVAAIDNATRYLVRLSAAIAGSDEPALRQVMAENNSPLTDEKIEEIILQSYLFAGFPRALNAMRAWRVFRGRPASASTVDAESLTEHRKKGEATCAIVYGASYEKLRKNIRELHPALDAWMIVEGYGKVLSRPGIDLKTRELCIVAACAATGQRRQLHSHLRGALNSGASRDEVAAAIDALHGVISERAERDARDLLARVAGK